VYGCRPSSSTRRLAEVIVELVADEFIAERVRLALAEVAELARLVRWKSQG
jgi:hypothetical protein